MTTIEEDQKEIADNVENPENPEEEKEEEEPVDLELQKEMKGLKINDSDFTNQPKTKKPYKKSKNHEDKKSKKKGQDFLDYANKNNIEINLEYEENKFQNKKNGEKNGKFNDNKRQYNKGGYKNEKNYQQKKQPKFTGNKFDTYGQRIAPNYYQRPPIKLVDNKEILEYLETIFSEENLNKDTYIRNRLKDGKILVDDIAAYNDIKRNNINSQKIIEIIKDSQNLECVNEEDKNYIKIKNFDKFELMTLEQIIQKKKEMKMQKMTPYMPQMGQYPFNGYGYNNFINTQNNYYFYRFPPYGNPNAYIPNPENK